MLLLVNVAGILQFIAFFAILFTKKWPRGLFDFTVQIYRWTANVSAYALLLLRDEYPPFTGETGRVSGDPRGRLRREPVPLADLRQVAARDPALLRAGRSCLIAANVAVFIAFFAILFTGRYPRGLFDFVVGTMRWCVRVKRTRTG